MAEVPGVGQGAWHALAAQPDQHRHQHQPRAVRRGHQERPQHQLARPDAHADPARVAEAGGDLVGGEAEQRRPPQRQEQPLRDHQPEHADRDRGQSDGQRVAEGDRPQRRRHRAQPPLLQAQGDGEEPAHGRVQSVEGAQGRQRQPGPECVHSS